MAGFDFAKVFGKDSAAYQLFVWTVLSEFVQTLGQPAILALQQLVLSHAPIVPLSVAEAVDAAQKGHVTPDAAAAEALLSGVSRERFDILLNAAGQPLSPQELVVAMRRGLIPEKGEGAKSVSFEQGIRESALAVKWAEVVKGLATQLPSPIDALQALLEGQVEEAEGRRLYELFGGDPQYFQMLFDTRGSAPSPVEASEMAIRGFIPWDGTGPDAVSFRQAGLEGPFRNKWLDSFRQLAQYRPPVRTITAMVTNGALTDDAALKLYGQWGMDAEAAAAQLADAHHTKTKPEHDLTVGTIKSLYLDGFIDRAITGELLGALRYSAESVVFYIDIWDFEGLQAKVRQSVSKIHSLYVAHKIDETTVTTDLDRLGVAASGRDEMLSRWKLEREANVEQLTAAQIADAVFYELLDFRTGVQRLVQLGWTQDDAVLRIAIRLHGNIPPLS